MYSNFPRNGFYTKPRIFEPKIGDSARRFTAQDAAIKHSRRREMETRRLHGPRTLYVYRFGRCFCFSLPHSRGQSWKTTTRKRIETWTRLRNAPFWPGTSHKPGGVLNRCCASKRTSVVRLMNASRSLRLTEFATEPLRLHWATLLARTTAGYFFPLILLGKDTGENQTLLLELVPQLSTLQHLSSFHDSPAVPSEKQRPAIGLFPLTVPPRSALPPVRFFAKLSPIQMVLYVYIIRFTQLIMLFP